MFQFQPDLNKVYTLLYVSTAVSSCNGSKTFVYIAQQPHTIKIYPETCRVWIHLVLICGEYYFSVYI